MRNRYLRFENLQERELFAADLQAAADLVDANQDGVVSHLDLLYVINSINAGQSVSSQPTADVNQNGRIEHLDLLAVINHLNHNALTAPGVATTALKETQQIQTAVLSKVFESSQSTAPAVLIGVRVPGKFEQSFNSELHTNYTNYINFRLHEAHRPLSEDQREKLSERTGARFLEFNDIYIQGMMPRLKGSSEHVSFISISESATVNEDGTASISFYTGGIIQMDGEAYFTADLQKIDSEWQVTKIDMYAIS